MAAFRYPRTSQPQSPVGVDYSGLGKGVRMLLTQQGGRVVDIANPGVIWTRNGNASTKPTPKGIAATFDGVDDYFSASGYANIVGAKGTFFMWIPRIGALDSSGTVWFGTNTGSASWFQSATNTAYCFGGGSFTAATISNVANSTNTSLVFAANTTINTQRYFRNGVSEGTPNASTPTAFAAGSKNFNFGRYIGGASWDADADIVVAGFTTEVWGTAQAKAFHENPWQLFTPQSRQIFVPSTGGGVNYSLLCDAGAFTLAGQDATLTYTAGTANYTLACDAGAYVLAGQDAALTYTPGYASVAYSLLCDAGAYALAGQDATLTYVSNAPVAYSLLCETGAYSITGQEATFSFSGGSQDTHDGYWSKQWEKLRKKKPVIEEVIELVQEQPAIALAEVKEAVKREYPKVDYTQVLNNVQLQRFIAEQLLITLELRRIQDDEDDIETLLLML